MTVIAIILACLLIGLSVHGWSVTAWFVWVLSRARRVRPEDNELPKVAILMGLKGSDPDLQLGLERLMQLDYPSYELHIVIDSKSDPAWDTVQAAIAQVQATHVHVDVYRLDPRTGPVNCTNSKQMQSLQRLDDSIEIVAMADGDLVAHPDWLRELVAPLVRNENVAAAFGNRWFMPDEATPGALVRYIWNVAAVMSMYYLNLPWGGCFAIKMSVIRDLNLVEKWSRIIAFDAATPGELKRAGHKIRFVPTLLMPNQEQCRLAFCLNFFQRQLTWTRLYHPAWPAIAGYAFLAGLVPLLASVVLLTALIIRNDFAAGLLTAALATNCIAQWLLMPLVQRSVERVIHDQAATGWMTLRRFVLLLAMLPVTQLIQWLALLGAMFCRSVRWRGITLEIHSPTDIRMRTEPASPIAAPPLGARESL